MVILTTCTSMTIAAHNLFSQELHFSLRLIDVVRSPRASHPSRG